MTGLGGAYAASAEGVEGDYVNAAAPAIRDPYSHSWFDTDISLSLSFPGAYAVSDFENRGAGSPSRFNDFWLVNLGATLQFGALGTSFTSDLQRVSLTARTADEPGLDLVLTRWNFLAAYSFMHGQLALGGGIRAVSFAIAEQGLTQRSLFTMVGAAPQAGALLRPNGLPWRLGATLRAPVTGLASQSGFANAGADGVQRVGEVALPGSVAVPWELEFGLAYQLGPRPLNPTWLNPHDMLAPLRTRIAEARTHRLAERDAALARLPPGDREQRTAILDRDEEAARAIEEQRLDVEERRLLELRRARYNNWPREKILFLASALVTGASTNAISTESFLDQRYDPVGRSTTVSPRFGIEGEPVPRWLRARTGSYVEPSRWQTGSPRQHFTFGGDVRLFEFNAWGLFPETFWRVSFAADLAPRFSNWSVGIGVWH